MLTSEQSSPVECEIATENNGFVSTTGRKSILAADSSPSSEAGSSPGSWPGSADSDRASKPSHSDSSTPAASDDEIVPSSSKTRETLCQMTAPKRQKSSMLLQKQSQIADEACIVFAIHYAYAICDMHDSTLSAIIPDSNLFSSFFHIDSGASFLQSIPRLCQAIEYTSLGEQHCRIWKRIAMAHFFHSYEYAQKNSESFFGWYRNLQGNMLLPKGSMRSMVAQCFANLMLRPANATAIDSQRSRLNKIQTWRKCGKPWAKLITAFGYGILLLIPMSLADEE
ncbi:hypothetical protein NQ176_g5315 [Zarea fungicola]|uniref:Uncharacterized protein n=1 Tax=Zarea fungicola TaxID=93591 RepID=A0ACC1NBI4_9HYPO|nr:hypothetical protein NQ176_g5315 [Lecanicillium fungicola]